MRREACSVTRAVPIPPTVAIPHQHRSNTFTANDNATKKAQLR